MTSGKDFDLLDNYLTNKLSDIERADFEKTLITDAELQNELKLQQAIVQGLKNARLSELKNVLRNVPAGSLPGTNSLGLKIAATIALSAIMGAALYYMWPKAKNTKESNLILSEPKDTPPPPEKYTGENQPLVIDGKEEDQVRQSERKTNKKKAKQKDLKIEVFDPSADRDEDINSELPAIEEGAAPDISGTSSHPPVLVEVDSDSRKLAFHYQFSNDKLVLYGPFEHNLYEILEFISDDKRTVFLFYRDKYYFISETTKATSLTAVKDPNLLQKLRNYKETN